MSANINDNQVGDTCEKVVGPSDLGAPEIEVSEHTGEDGQGEIQNLEQAFKCLEQVAKQGNAAAQYSLGEMYFKGVGVHKDRRAARSWFTKAAEQNDVNAQLKLGKMYQKGQGGKKTLGIRACGMIKRLSMVVSRLSIWQEPCTKQVKVWQKI